MSSNTIACHINKVVLALHKKLLREIEYSREHAAEYQSGVFNTLINCGQYSKFGKQMGLSKIKSLGEFQKRVPLFRYEELHPYIERLRQGEDYVLWNQKVKWYAKSSGTSSEKSKYIPLTPDSLRVTHFGGMKRMLVNYVRHYPQSRIFSSKALTLGGSVTPVDSYNGGAYGFEGDLSAVMLKNSPTIVELIRTPSKKVALIGDFAKKVELICKESIGQNVSNFSGVPSWNLVLLNKILEHSGKSNILEVWPQMELFMHGGISFSPYRQTYKKLFPSNQMHYLENYNASEGYFAFQDEFPANSLENSEQADMLLTVNNGVFYEFIPFNRYFEIIESCSAEAQGEKKGGSSPNLESCIVPLEGVTTGVDYAIVISTFGGLWRYVLEDCVRFTSINPYRIIVTGRTKLYINAFGEELMIDNAEKALSAACSKAAITITDYTVAPVFMEGKEQGYHLWAVEFTDPLRNPASKEFSTAAVEEFAELLDRELTKVNSDYEAKRSPGSTMQRLKIKPVAPGTFYKWMESRGKTGGQNKVPRLHKDLTYIHQLQ
ncbi:MAG: GH3 auxin-responsive promoter family protein [Bacteroidales bacterium]|nr:GH3 auxin-responsive promoter family protein [Bacteroidales bacterium]